MITICDRKRNLRNMSCRNLICPDCGCPDVIVYDDGTVVCIGCGLVGSVENY